MLTLLLYKPSDNLFELFLDCLQISMLIAWFHFANGSTDSMWVTTPQLAWILMEKFTHNTDNT